MWLATRGLDFKEIQNYFANANYFWVALAAVFGLLAYWFRAVRWNIMFEPMGYRSSVYNSFWSISFGYLMNLTIPRSGELARATALYKVEKIPVENSFGTIVLERIIDLLCMMLFSHFDFCIKIWCYSSVLATSPIRESKRNFFIAGLWDSRNRITRYYIVFFSSEKIGEKRFFC